MTMLKERISGQEKQLQLAGVTQLMNYFSWFPANTINFTIVYVVVVVGSIFLPVDLKGLWLPMILWVIAQQLFCYFYVQWKKFTNYKSEAEANRTQVFLLILFMFIMCGTMAMALWMESTIWRYLEWALCITPMSAGEFAASKITYRSALAKRDEETGKLDLNPWGISGAGPEMIGMAF